MTTTITWSGPTGAWSQDSLWQTGVAPVSGDDVAISIGSVTLDSAGAAQDVAVADATLDLTGTLQLSGTLSLAGGADLLLDGTVAGGWLTVAGGSVVASGGTLLGVTVTGGFAALGGATVDTATVQQSVASGGTVMVSGTLGLASGTYDAVTFDLDQDQGGATLLQAGAGASVTFGAAATVALTQTVGVVDYPLADTVAGLTGAGEITNLGTITSDIGNAAGVPISIDVAGFVNAGTMMITPLTAPDSGNFTVGRGGPPGRTYPIQGLLDWTAAYAPTLDIASASFANIGSLLLGGGTLDLSGAAVSNAGDIMLSDATTQAVTTDASGVASVADTVLATLVDIGAGVTAFANTGTIAADTIEFDNSLTLSDLGTLHGDLLLTGTLDLGGGTLDASRYSGVTIAGTLENGVLDASGGSVTLDGATLRNVGLAGGNVSYGAAPVTLIDPPAAGTATLDGNVTRVDLLDGTTLTGAIVAGSTLTTDIVHVAGTVTLGPSFTLTAGVAASTVLIANLSATLVNDGLINVNGASLDVIPTLDGGGMIDLSAGAAVTLEALAPTAAQLVSFGAGDNTLVVPGTGALNLSLAGLQAGDTIDFVSVSSVPLIGQFAEAGASAQDGQLDVTGASGDFAMINLTSSGDGLFFTVVSDGSSGTLVEANCFVAGTLLATPGGVTPVERLRAGDMVLLACGSPARVTWVGQTTVDLARHPHPAQAAPIRIRAGAFGDGLPVRDLLVSPEHCLLADGALTPALRLANGATIARDDSFTTVSYWHVELDRHAILLAEGLPAESYLDTGRRGLFAGEAGVRPLLADFTAPPDADALAVWAARGAAPLRLDAPATRARLIARAEALGWRRGRDAGLTLWTGAGVLPATRTPHGLRALLPAGTRAVRLDSRSIVPAETIAGSGDTRRLGVAVRAALLAGWPPHPDAFAQGWQAPRDGEPWRWTSGTATLALPRLARPTVLELRLAPAAIYWQEPSPAAPLARAARAA